MAKSLRKPRIGTSVAIVIPCAIAFSVAIVCVLFIPHGTRQEALSVEITYKVTQEGNIIWRERDSGNIRLVVESNIRSVSKDEDRVSTQQKMGSLGCDEGTAYIRQMQVNTSKVQCFEVYSARGGLYDCSEGVNLTVQDCILMSLPHQATAGDNVYWYGGSELYLQEWPINNVTKQRFGVYLSSDLPWRHGNVLERYWLSSSGAAVFVHADVPLFVNVKKNEKICLRADYNATQGLGAGYSPPRNTSDRETVTELRYAVCFGEDALATHEAIITDQKAGGLGFIERPADLPDLKMLKEPIWSTWARYKADINQTVIEEFAHEILENHFTNSQLEIDDGYERAYGDFAFDLDKFPNATEMIQNLREKGFRITTWVTPFINTGSKNYLQGRINGFFIQTSEADSSPDLVTWWNGIGAALDFTNPEAAAWYESLLTAVKQTYGLDSFKFDAGETNYVPRKGYTKHHMKNPGEYTTLYAHSAHRVGGEMMEMRSAWRTQSLPIYMRMMDKGSRWNGFKGLETVIPTALIFGITGYPYVLPDMIGGNAYGNRVPDKELYIRWLEVTAFMPVMQFSIAPWDYDDEVTEISRYYTQLHRGVVYEEIIRTAQNYVEGRSVFLPVSPIWFLADSSENDAFHCADEFLVGDRYLVAPVLIEGARKRDVYLPRGSLTGEPIQWRDMVNVEVGENTIGGRWIKDYPVGLNEISWWERIDPT